VRIAICSAGELYGGVEQFIYLYAQHLRALDHAEAIVILFHDGQLSNRLRGAGIETHVVSYRLKYDPRAVRDVARILSCRHIDVVHTHGYRANVICAVAAASVGIPVVKTEHGKLEVALSPRLGSAKMYLNMLIDQVITLAFVGRVVYVTFDLSAKFRAIHRFKSTSVIHNGIGPIPSCSTDPPEPFDKRDFNIGIVGRVSRIKGHMFLLSAVERLSDIQNLRLHIIGRGPLESKLKKDCISRGIESRVKFWGFREDIHHLMRNLDVLVMPSLYEALPYTLLEAMYLRVPIIGSGVGGLREILSDGENAVLVPPGDVEKLAAAIRLMHDDPGQRNRTTERAFSDVTSRFIIRDMARRYIEVYGVVILRVGARGSVERSS
jgi:glycosyltransferase involved in cell wall biosynthesis